MKQLGEKVLGWFVVEEGEKEEEKEEIVVLEEAAEVTPPPKESDEVKKVMDLIASLPDGAPLEVQRAIVIASLEAFGIRIDRVLASAMQAERSLEGRARAIDQEIGKQQRLAKSVAEERARLRAVGVFFNKS
jgi:hypothetical protein